MIIKQAKELPKDLKEIVSKGHETYEASHGILCKYTPFVFIAKDESQNVLGVLQGYTAFAEVYIDDLWVDTRQRKKGIGRALMNKVEEEFKDKGFNNINLVTSAFQAVEFYKKCGYQVEFVRKNKINPKLTKNFFIKFFNETNQNQGIL